MPKFLSGGQSHQSSFVLYALMDKNLKELVSWMRSCANATNAAGMARYGIASKGLLGISMPVLRAKAKEIGKNHALAVALWETGYHEARILAPLIANPAEGNDALLEHWVADFDSWDVCDQACNNYIYRCDGTPERAARWCRCESEFTRRAGFVLICSLACHAKKMPDEDFLPYLDLIREYSQDERNFVRKAVNWALRDIAKRRVGVRPQCMELTNELIASRDKTARWIGRDAKADISLKIAREQCKKNTQG